MDENKILYTQTDGVHYFRFQGEVLHDLAPALDRFLRHLAGSGGSDSYLLDFTETRAIDSTMLGLMARVAKLAKTRGAPPPTLLCPNEEIIDLLVGIGFDEVFQMIACNGHPVGDAEVLAPEETDDRSLAKTMLEAHQELIALKAENRLLFEDVMEILRAILDRPED